MSIIAGGANVTSDRPAGYEYKHMEIAQDQRLVDVVTNAHAMFYWELQATQTVVSKEAHLESGKFNPDNLYSVVSTERFVTLDFRRPTNIPNLPKIKQIEREYFELCASLVNLGCSPLANYSDRPPMRFNPLIFLLLLGIWVIPGVWYLWRANKKRLEATEQSRELRARLDRLISNNKTVLSVVT